MFELYCRLYQELMHRGEYLLPWREPQLFEGEDSLDNLPTLLVKEGITKVLIVTDQNISQLGLLDNMLHALQNRNIEYVIYDGTVANPTDANIEEAARVFTFNACQAIIAFGGGSSIDCAKGVGAKIVRPKKEIMHMEGLFKIRKSIPLLIAVPTTAGTGSEATIAAVISDAKTHDKRLILDLALIPHYAILDPLLTIGLPPEITSATGMDALTHAIESYIGRSSTKKTRDLSLRATQLIFDNLPVAYDQGTDLSARINMLKASYYAGVAFTRANVGYVHALAHAVGGLYGVPHGLANAVILPHILKMYGKAAHIKLAHLADVSGLTQSVDTPSQRAASFIHAIDEMNQRMNHPKTIQEIKESDIHSITEHAYKEANPFYPVPKILTKAELTTVVRTVAGL